MKLYSESKHASIQMNFDEKFNEVLVQLLFTFKIDLIIESGTYLGLGSTKHIAEVIKKANLQNIVTFFTIESNKGYFEEAVKNLKNYEFVIPLLGQSINLNEAVKFLENDQFLLNHKNFDDVYIDSFDPVKNYLNELKGNRVRRFLNRIFFNPKQNLLKDIIELNLNKSILIILDSAGGIGWFEFNEVLRIMAGNSFLLVLDDTNHVKHFRSRNYILENPKQFQVYYDNYEFGVLICNVLY
jgi:hypothetical protein